MSRLPNFPSENACHFLFCICSLLVSAAGAKEYALKPVWPKLRFPDCPVAYAYAQSSGAKPFQVVALQRGLFHVLPEDRDAGQAPVFLDLREAMRDEIHFEAGVHSIAFHPGFDKNRRVFVSYSQSEPRRNVLSEFTVPKNASRADPATERIILEVPHQLADHFSGSIAFGPDGFLYWSIGDGGLRDDPHRSAQHPFLFQGKLLRLDVNQPSGRRAYTIPEDNPFVGQQEWHPEIYAFGFRNPWGLSFDCKSGQLWATDVGQDLFEEINVIKAGGNYGWSVRDGNERLLSRQAAEEPPGDYLAPIHTYSRAQSEGICIVGGAVYHGTRFPELDGCYIYGDWGYGKIWALRPDEACTRVESNTLLVQRDEKGERFNPTHITTGCDGEALILCHSGLLYTLERKK
jgi:glucose/arabinose dehydrogenase